MWWIKIFAISLTASSSYALISRKFPADFKFGVATASYQIEGGWDADGKGENIWDHLIHTNPDFVKDRSSGDIACDSYHKFKEDVALLKDLGVYHYRFSLSWSRILPTGLINKINKAGIDYYKKLIKELKANGIEPMITLYHWDLPQPLQDIGGWPNDKLIEYFADYAELVFNELGDDVKYWFTFNEIQQICHQGYGLGTYAPAIKSPGVGEYLCGHNVLRAHARAYHIYQNKFKAKQNGRVSIVIDTSWFEPASNNSADAVAAERLLQFFYGWFANPVVYGNYPQVMIERIRNRSLAEGFKKSRLPTFTAEESRLLKGTYDFVALNHYTTYLVSAISDPPLGQPSFNYDVAVHISQDSSWAPTASAWLRVVPWGARKILNWIKKTYNNPEIIITENGYSDRGTCNDDKRVKYFQTYLSNIRDAILIDKVNVTGYTAWSLLDNFEWGSGYTEKFGLYEVNFTSPNRTRTPKQSSVFYKKLIATRCLDANCVY